MCAPLLSEPALVLFVRRRSLLIAVDIDVYVKVYD